MKEVENLRVLCAEIVERAKSGHPGSPMGLSHFMHILYTEYLVLDPENPRNPSRDIFVLSNGHACVIQYVMNYFLGFLDMEDLKAYRTVNSRTPGHPERNAHGIEISTGPLGQGVAASVGFAISAELISRHGRMNGEKPHVYCVFGDGCYQEGIAQEAFSFCSRQGLSNITFVYDYNGSTIDGSTELSMDEDVVARFRALRFTVLEADGYDPDAIRRALDARSGQPKVIVLRTAIGKDSVLEGNCKAHGAPLGEEAIAKLKALYGAPREELFVSQELRSSYARARRRMSERIAERAARNVGLQEIIGDSLRISYAGPYESKDAATRRHFADALNSIATNQLLLSGCADLTGSVLSKIDSAVDFRLERGMDAYLRFGIREHAMCAVMNGIAAHGVFVPVSGTFLNFITYGYPAVRLAALDNLKVVYVLSHDSIQLGGDGPTHQPVEVLATMRATPNLVVLRPCDGRETRAALVLALREAGPVAVVLSRQKVPEIEGTRANGDGLACEGAAARGAYYLVEEKGHEVILLATGAEVALAYGVRERMRDRRISIVSFISFELFERQDDAYRARILDRRAVKISIEALSTFGWARYSDFQIGLDRFGLSGPGDDVYEHLGFSPGVLAIRIAAMLGERRE